MKADQLITMANRIAQFFAAMPEPDESLEGVATHLRKFWEPRMRKQLVEIAAGPQRGELHSLVLNVVDDGRL